MKNKKLVLSVLSTAVVASMASSAFAAPQAGLYFNNTSKFYKLSEVLELSDSAYAEFKQALTSTSNWDDIVLVKDDGKGAFISEILDTNDPGFAEPLVAEDFLTSYNVVGLDGNTAGTYDARKDVTPGQTGELKVESVSAIDANQVKVVFNGAVADTTKATFALKKGAANYFSEVAWNEAKTEAVVTGTIALPAGEYTLEVTGLSETPLTKTVTFEAVKVDSIAVISNDLELKAGAALSYEVRNQYGKDMKVAGSNVTALAYNVTQGKSHVITANGTAFAFSTNFATASHADAAKVGDVIRVTLNYSGKTVQKELTVKAAAQAATVELGTVAPLEGKARIYVSDSGLTLPVTVADQYGTAVKLNAHTPDQDTVVNAETIDGVTFTSSNPAIVDVDTFAVNADGKVTFDAGSTDGTATITAMVNATGDVKTTTVTVNKAATVGAFNLTQPTTIVAGGDTIKVAYAALDQFGSTIIGKLNTHTANATTANDLETLVFNGVNLDVTSSDPTIVDVDKITVDAKGELSIVTEKKAGSVTLTVKNGTTTVGTLTLDVQEPSVPTKIKQVSTTKTVDTNLVEDEVVDVKVENFVFVDQYNRPYTLTGTEGLVAWFSDGAQTSVDLGDQTADYTTKDGSSNADAKAFVLTNDNSTSYLKVKGLATTGAEKVKFQLTKNVGAANANLVAGSEFEVTFNNTAKPNSYTVATDKTEYTADENITVTITATKTDGSVATNYNETGFGKVALDTIAYNKAITFVNGVATVTVPATTTNADFDVHVDWAGATHEIGTSSDGDIKVTAGAFTGFTVASGADTDEQVTITAVDADGNTVTSYAGNKLANFKLTDKDLKPEALSEVDAEGNIVITFTSGVATDVKLDEGGAGAGDITATDILTAVIDGVTVKKTF